MAARAAGARTGGLRASHAVTVLQFQMVLSTWKRQGAFSRAAGEIVASCWRRLAETRPLVIEKVSFVPDHVHLAVRAHPSTSPAEFVVELMNASQERMWNDFADLVIEGGVDRLWQPSAYIGSYGDLESRKTAGYVRNWEADPDL